MASESIIVHSLDKTTLFLSQIGEAFPKNYTIIQPEDKSIDNVIKAIKGLSSDSLIVFLGHGTSFGLYSPENETFKKRIIIDSEIGDSLFKSNNVLLLSCNSNQLISHLKSYRRIIGFGNIISSREELTVEAENITGSFRNLDDEDIEHFNDCYCKSITYSLKLVLEDKYEFKDLPKLIEFYINKNICTILRDKSKKNRVEVAKLLFEFRNDMIYKQNI